MTALKVHTLHVVAVPELAHLHSTHVSLNDEKKSFYRASSYASAVLAVVILYVTHPLRKTPTSTDFRL